jgi:hypothetical protein
VADNEKKKHGGARKGSGRKAVNGKTNVMRIPAQFQNAVVQLIEHLSEQSKAGVPSLKREIHLRDLLDRRILLEINTKLNKVM